MELILIHIIYSASIYIYTHWAHLPIDISNLLQTQTASQLLIYTGIYFILLVFPTSQNFEKTSVFRNKYWEW